MSPDTRNEFLRSVDIVAIVSDYVTLRRHGREYQGLCPFHSERTPSFSVNADKGFWYCHGCHEGGDVVSFIAKVEGIGRGQAIRQLAQRQGISLSSGSNTESAAVEDQRERLHSVCTDTARFYHEKLLTEEAEGARTYLRNRGVDKSCAELFGLGYAPQAPDALYQKLIRSGYTLEEMEEAGVCMRGDSGPLDRMRHRMIIPIADAQGRVIAFGGRAIGDGTPKYLNSPDTLLFHKSHTLYLLHRARRAIQKEGTAIIVEGYLDCLMAHHYGIENVVATLGTAITSQHVQTLRRLSKRVLFALDSDEAGARAVERASALVDQEGMEIRIISFPSGMDPDAFLRSFGPDQFRDRINAAVGIVEFQMANILRKADLSVQQGKTEAMQQCIQVLGGVRSPMLRDRYVDDLARLWAGAQASGSDVLDNIEVIREEVTRKVRSSLRGGRTTSAHRISESSSSNARIATETEQAEAGLLAAIIKRPVLLDQCAEFLSPEEFRKPAHQIIYSQLLNYGNLDALSNLEDETAISVAAFVLSESEHMMDDENALQMLFNDCLRKVKDYDRKMRFEELRRKFDQMATGNAGAMPPDELQEYYQLSRYLKGTQMEDSSAVSRMEDLSS